MVSYLSIWLMLTIYIWEMILKIKVLDYISSFSSLIYCLCPYLADLLIFYFVHFSTNFSTNIQVSLKSNPNCHCSCSISSYYVLWEDVWRLYTKKILNLIPKLLLWLSTGIFQNLPLYKWLVQLTCCPSWSDFDQSSKESLLFSQTLWYFIVKVLDFLLNF